MAPRLSSLRFISPGVRLGVGLLAVLSWEARGDLVGHWTFEAGEEFTELTGNFADLVLEGDAEVVDGALDLNGAGTTATGWAHASALPTGPPLASKTLVAWVTLQSLENGARHGAPLSVDLQSGDRFDGIVFAERSSNRWMNGSSNFQRSPAEQFDQPNAVETSSGEIVQLAIAYEVAGGSVTITGYRNGEVMGTFSTPTAATWSAGEYEALFGPRHSNPNPAGALDALLHEARIYDTALTQAEIQALTLSSLVDTDGDGLDDVWEQGVIDSDPGDAIETLAEVNPGDDLDGDTLTNEEEFRFPQTDPLNPDSDGDNLRDDVETRTGFFFDATDTGTDPNDPDSDNDGLQDGVETGTGIFVSASDTGTDPNNPDSDRDGLEDGMEVAAPFTDPNDANDPPPPPLDAVLIGLWTFDAGEELIDVTGNWNDLILESGASVNDGRLTLDGADGQGAAYAPGWTAGATALTDKTMVVWVSLLSLGSGQSGGAALSLSENIVPTCCGAASNFDSVNFGERVVDQWESGSDFFRRTPAGNSGLIETATGEMVQVAIVYESSEPRITIYREGKVYATYVPANPLETFDLNGDSAVAFGPRLVAGGGTQFFGSLEAEIEEARLYAAAATPAQILALFNAGPGRFGSKSAMKVESAGDDLVFTWDSAGGKLYNLRSEVDPSMGEPRDWPIFDGHAEMVATPPENSLAIPRPPDAVRFFVIEEFPAPPVSIFAENFDAAAAVPAGWITGATAPPDTGTTLWEFGTPANVGPAAANSAPNCAATNLTAAYGDESEIYLRTPPIDLTTASGATLHFAHYVDIEANFDSGTVSLLDANDGDAVIGEIADGIDGDGFAGWEEFSKSLPAHAIGNVVRIEWRFAADNFNTVAQAGWYVDNVRVTVP